VSGTTTVRGRLLSIEAPDSDPGGRAFLFGETLSGPPWGCRVKADSRGQFEFRGLPDGDYELRITGLGVHRSERIPLSVRGDSLITLDLPQFGTNHVLYCLQDPECAPILTRKPLGELNASEEEQLTLLGYRLALAMASSSWDAESPWAVCLPETSPAALIDTLGEVHPYVFPVSECEELTPPDSARAGPRKRWYHKGDLRPATVLAVERVKRAGEDLVEMTVAYHVGWLWAEGLRCDVRRIRGAWFPEKCWVRWTS
jgi:hypothetical protein